MARTQRVTGDLTFDPTGTINLNSNTTITGDLTVIGTTTSVQSTDTSVKDRLIVLNDGEAGAGVSGRFSGLEIERGSLNNAQIVFDENDDLWKISTDGGSTYVNILTGLAAGLTEVVQDTSPQLGGNLDVNGQSIVTAAASNADITLAPDGTGRVVVSSAAATVEEELKLDQYLRLVDQGGAPSQIAGSTLLYAAPAAGGGTGLFFVDGSNNDELTSKSKAIVYGLIF